MSDVVEASSPFFYCLSARIDRQLYSFFTEHFVQFGNAWWVGLINEGMVDIAYGGTRIDTSEFVDSENFLKARNSVTTMIVEQGGSKEETVEYK